MQVRIKWKEEKEHLILVKRKKKERKQKMLIPRKLPEVL